MKIIMFVLSFALISCSSTKSFNRGEYESVSEMNNLNDRFSETDAQLFSKMVSDEVKECFNQRKLKLNRLAIGNIVNRTDEHIDMEMIVKKVSYELYKNGNIRFVDKDSRRLIKEEIDYGDNEYVAVASRIEKGTQLQPEYLVNAIIYGNTQQLKKEMTRYYMYELNIVSTSNGMIECQSVKELRKRMFKQSED